VWAGKLRKLRDSLSELRSSLYERRLERTVLMPSLLSVKTAQFTQFFRQGMKSHSKIAQFNPLTPNDPYRGRTAPLTSKRCILYIYSINTGTEYFKHGIYCPFFSSSKCSLFHNSNVFGSCIIHILYTGCAKIKKKIIPAPKG